MVIETISLTKLYNNKIACKEICLSVPEGQIFGFLGPNGAGKSTLVKMLLGLIFPTSGEAQILGRPLGDVAARKKIGYLPENFRYHEWLTGLELLQYHAAMYGLGARDVKARIEEALDVVGLAGRERQKVGTYSKGMQQRIGLAIAMLPGPELVFLDEPTSALDPIGRREVREILKVLKQKGCAVFLNSHLLSEVELVCDHVAFIKKGELIASGSMEELLAKKIELEVVARGINEQILVTLRGLGTVDILNDDKYKITLDNEEKIPLLAQTITRGGAQLYQLSRGSASLEDLFIHLLQEVR